MINNIVNCNNSWLITVRRRDFELGVKILIVYILSTFDQ